MHRVRRVWDFVRARYGQDALNFVMDENLSIVAVMDDEQAVMDGEQGVMDDEDEGG